MKSHFTTVGPLEKNFWPLHGKIHLTPKMLVWLCGIIIITP